MPAPVDKNINELVNEALRCWADLTGAAKIMGDTCPILKWDLRQHLEGLNESREMDPTGLTTFMMLRGLADEIFQETKFTAQQLITAADQVETSLRPLRALRDLVEAPQVVALIEEFVECLRQASLDHGMEKNHREKLEELFASRYALGFLRRDALLSMQKLEHHQFVQGAPDTVPLKKNEIVYEFLNANSAVEAALAQRISGISLALVRDPEVDLASYFVFLVRNGETITLLTDREEGPHPAYNRMSRRPDRNLERRAAQNWFPYQLMDLECKHVDDRLHVHRTALVRYNTTAVPLKKISELEPEQFVWIVLMFDLIREQYGRRCKLLPELSYTGEMVAEPHALVGADAALVLSGHYQPLELPVLTPDEVLAAREDTQWDSPSTKFNAWMEERYGTQVPATFLSVVGDSQKQQLQEQSGTLLPPILPDWDHGETLPRQVEITALSPVTFGTREKLQTDRLWVGRVNKMKYVQALAEAEYEAEREQIYAWYRTACQRNADLFLDGLARGDLPAPCYTTHDPDMSFHEGYSRTTTQNCLTQWLSLKKWRRDTYGFLSEKNGSVLLAQRRPNQTILCHDRGIQPSIIGQAQPTCPEALALFAGTTISELPWPLQHWYSSDPYYGNDILNRVEPSDWVLKNPWMSWNDRHHSMTVTMALSRSALRARRKKLGLPPLKISTDRDEEDS